MADKDQTAKRLAQAHYELEPGILKIFRLEASPEIESRPTEPVKLLEVNENTIPAGIVPLQFDSHPANGFNYPSLIIEITPDEFEEIEGGTLQLPTGWTIRGLLPRPPKRESAIA